MEASRGDYTIIIEIARISAWSDRQAAAAADAALACHVWAAACSGTRWRFGGGGIRREERVLVLVLGRTRDRRKTTR